MFVSLRLGVLIRVLAAVGLIGAVVTLLISAGTAPRVTPAAPSSVPHIGVEVTNEPRVIVYRVAGTGGVGLNVRACAKAACPKVGWLAEGSTMRVTCWRSGSAVSGERKWLRGTVDGAEGFASAHYLRPRTTFTTPECYR